MNPFQQIWSRFHDGLTPTGYGLRDGGADNWVRFHSLPSSKRYADTDDERRTILQRHKLLAAEVLKSDPCWLVQTHWITPAGMTDLADVHDPFAATRQFDLQPAFEFADDDEDAVCWRVHAGRTRWTDGAFDELLTSIAEERAGPTLWISETTGSVFAPYDGGVDLFLAKPEQVEALKATHGDWLSDHPAGL
jgi:hypothetical protein